MQAVNAAGSGDYSDLLTTITSEDSKLCSINDVTITTFLPIVFFLACMCSNASFCGTHGLDYDHALVFCNSYLFFFIIKLKQ